MDQRQEPEVGLAGWLLRSKADLPAAIEIQLMNGLFTSVPIFTGGIVNSIVVASVATWRQPTMAFVTWVLFEVALGVVRLTILLNGLRAMEMGNEPPRRVATLLACAWAASVGIGTFMCLASGDWVLATIACLSAAAMVCGICLRNFGTPRLVGTMVCLVLVPCAIAGLLSPEPIMPLIGIQLPIYLLTIISAAFSLHGMTVARMTVLAELERSETLNETILRASPDYTLILDDDHCVFFCNHPDDSSYGGHAHIGQAWLDLLPERDRALGARVLEEAKAGVQGNLTIQNVDEAGSARWFDIIVNRISEEGLRLIVVARDITHQKKSEESAIWIAQHDALTGLPNRAVLQDRLDAMLDTTDRPGGGALLIVDVDNFKSINDTLGHDAGDALLCRFASQLQAAVEEGDMVARTGGDEFALVLAARADRKVQRTAARIFEQLREPFNYAGRLVEYSASIGASFIPRDGKVRSDVMKAADIALYAAKASGRATMKIFEPQMMVEVERHQAMIGAARYALQNDAIMAHYQPKISLRTSATIGFEALLRWRARDGSLAGPDRLGAAFDDPGLGGQIGERMLENVLRDVQGWLEAGIPFGHVALNVAAVDFRRKAFAQTLLDRLRECRVPADRIQIEVTETVFLGQGAEDVRDALRCLSNNGIRIALDDFGTGYASLSHLNQFPVDILKIDKSFIGKLGSSPDAEAISATVVNLGHCLGLEVVAEGVETTAQERHLIGMGCDTGQGFLYSRPLAANDIAAFLSHEASMLKSARRA